MLTLCWGPLQTFSQFLANLAGTSNKQTQLQSTLSSNNIAGLYKHQTTNDQSKYDMAQALPAPERVRSMCQPKLIMYGNMQRSPA